MGGAIQGQSVTGQIRIDFSVKTGDIPRMVTLKADDRSRVKLPDIKPGQVFAYENKGNGILTLTEVRPVEPPEEKPAKVRFVKKGRYTVGVTDRPINMQALQEALKEFP